MLNELSLASQGLDHGDRLDAAIYALVSVMKFVDADAAAVGLTRPIANLVNSLHDVSRGIRPALFEPQKPEGAGAAFRPTNLAFHHARAAVVRAIDILMAAGYRRTKAGELVAKKLMVAGVRDTTEPSKHPKGKPITAAMVLRWRAEIDGRAPAATGEMLARLTAGECRSGVTKSHANRAVDGIVAGLRSAGF